MDLPDMLLFLTTPQQFLADDDTQMLDQLRGWTQSPRPVRDNRWARSHESLVSICFFSYTASKARPPRSLLRSHPPVVQVFPFVEVGKEEGRHRASVDNSDGTNRSGGSHHDASHCVADVPAHIEEETVLRTAQRLVPYLSGNKRVLNTFWFERLLAMIPHFFARHSLLCHHLGSGTHVPRPAEDFLADRSSTLDLHH